MAVWNTSIKQFWNGADVAKRIAAYPIITLVIVAANLFTWCAVAWLAGQSLFSPQNSYMLLHFGAVNGELFLSGEWWRIITSQFLHVRFPHMIFNMLAALVFGMALERHLGSLRFAFVYAFSGVAGQISSVIAYPALVTSGASQAVMGLAGALATKILWRGERKIFELIPLLIIVGIQLTLDVATARHVKVGHLVGFGAGVIVGCLICYNGQRQIVESAAETSDD